jgi:hypothetical protein
MRIADCRKIRVVRVFGLQLFLLLGMAFAPLAPIQQTQEPPLTATPDPGGGEETPQPTGAPGPTATPTPGGISQIIHRLLFPAETIAEALTNVFAEAAQDEAQSLQEQAGDWSLLLGHIVQAPSRGYYQAIAQSSLPVAAALAPALFLLRLALYHWRRLVGDDDSALMVIGDWVAAGFLAVAAGPFLDLLTEIGWWIAGATLGETGQLAFAFVQSTTVFSVMDAVAQVSLFSGILVLLMTVGGILAMAGMLFAFGAANAALYVMAIVAAPIAVAGVLRHMRWMRSLWIKAVAVLALLPVIAGGIFKAGVTLGAFFAGEGLLSLLIRLLWLWGATGFLIALAGILSRVTLSASVGALGQLSQSVKAVASTALMAGSVFGGGAGAVGRVGGAAAGGGSPVGGGAAGAFPGGAPTPGWGSGGAIMDHYDQAAALTQQAGTYAALGLQAPAQYARTQVRGHELAARKLELGQRLARYSGYVPGTEVDGEDISKAPDFGFSPTVNRGIAATFSNTVTGFEEGFLGLSTHIEQAGFDPRVVAERYPEDTGRMVSAYLDHPDRIDQAQEPLLEAAKLGGADDFRTDIFGGQESQDVPEPPLPPDDRIPK